MVDISILITTDVPPQMMVVPGKHHRGNWTSLVWMNSQCPLVPLGALYSVIGESSRTITYNVVTPSYKLVYKP